MNKFKQNIFDEIISLKSEFNKESENIKNINDINKIRVKYLGRKGAISSYFRMLGEFSVEKRALVGKKLNELKKYIENKLEEINKSFIEVKKKFQ